MHLIILYSVRAPCVPTNRTRASNTDARISAGFRMHLQDSNVHDNVLSLVHCKI